MENLDIFNLDAEALVTKVNVQGEKDLDFYKPYPENGKDGVYKSLVRFVPNIANAAKSKVHKYYVYLADPVSGDKFSADCPSTVGKKSILKDLYWKLQNSHSAADKELSKNFSRKEDYYALIQIIQDKNKPELEGKVMLFKFGKKLNDMIEAQLKPEYGDSCNPFDLFTGREFSMSVRKVGEWNNYDMCSFIGERTPIKVGGVPMKQAKEDMDKIVAYLNEGPKNLESFDYKDWSDEMTDKVMNVIRNSVHEQRLVNEVLSGVGSSSSNYAAQPAAQQSAPQRSQAGSSTDDIYNEVNKTNVGGYTPDTASSTATSAPSSLEDLYSDL